MTVLSKLRGSCKVSKLITADKRAVLKKKKTRKKWDDKVGGTKKKETKWYAAKKTVKNKK